MIDWLAGLPAWALFLVVGAFWFGVALLLDLVVHRRVPGELRTGAHGSTTVVLTVIAGIYAVLVTFVIVNEWQALGDAEQSVAAEAAALAQIYDNAATFPPADARAVQEAVIEYASVTTRSEWDAVSYGDKLSREGTAALRELFAAVVAVDPGSVQRQAFYDATVDQLDAVAQARRSLAAQADNTVPDGLILILVVTGLVVMGLAAVLDTEHRRAHLALLCAIALVVTLNLALVLGLDRPLAGPNQISKQPLQEIARLTPTA